MVAERGPPPTVHREQGRLNTYPLEAAPPSAPIADMQTLSQQYGPARMHEIRSYLMARHDQMEHALFLAERTNNTLYSSQQGREEVRGMRGRISALRAEIGIIDAALLKAEAA